MSLVEDSVFPSSRLPGALEVDPLVRKLASHSGLKVYDNTVWMLVVAAREYSSSLIKKIVANDQDFRSGHAPQVPNHFHTSLVRHNNSSANRNVFDGEERIQDVRAAEGDKVEKRVINSISLSHVLAENPTAASRLMSMHTAVAIGDRRGTSSLVGLEKVKCLINASIQRAASRRLKAFSDLQTKSSTFIPLDSASKTSTHTMIILNTQPDESPANLQPLTSQSLPNTILHLNKPQLVAPPPLPQCQPGFQTMPFHRVQSSQYPFVPVMNHSDHRNGENQTLPILSPNREPPSMLEATPPPLVPNVTEPPPIISSPTPNSTPPPSRGSKNLAAMVARPTSDDEGEARNKEEKNEEMEGQEDGRKVTESPAAKCSPVIPQGRGYGVKNLAAIKARSSATESRK